MTLPSQPPAPGPEPHPEPPSSAAPAPAGLDYEVVRLIGRGGYGEVWLVRGATGGYRACKVIYRESFDNDRPYEREYAGLQAFEPVSRASDSQVNILHVGRRDAEGYFYYLMELADDVHSGQEIVPEHYEPKTLRGEMMRRGRLPLSECIALGLSLSAALENLHQHGLIHRDVKPANIIFVNGLPKLADIGLVTEARVNVSYVGTEGYIPPEGPTSAQADVYALGKVLYELSTGRDRQDFPELPTDFADGPDRQTRLEFNAVVTKACESDPRRRYASARELHADLALIQSGGSVRRRRAARQRRLWLTRWALGLTLLLLVAGGLITLPRLWKNNAPNPHGTNPAPARMPLPSAEALAASESRLRESLKRELEDRSPEARLRLARELLTRGLSTPAPAEQLAELRLAANLATEAEDFALAMEACGRMEAGFQMTALPLKIELLTKSPLTNHSAGASAGLAEACVGAGFEALGEDDYEHATALAEAGQAVAEKAQLPHLVEQAEFLNAQAAQCWEAYLAVKPLVLKLRQEPANPEANLRVGQFRCFVKNDWETGLPALARGNEPALKAVLDRELRNKPVRPRDVADTGDLWWTLAQSAPASLKAHYEQRARYWYHRAISLAKTQEKLRLKERFGSRLQAESSPSGFLHFTASVGGAEHIVISADGLRWLSSRGSLHGRVNQVRVGDLQPGVDREVKNCGATRLLPEGVDFRSAQLKVYRKSGRRAKALLEKAEDHVRLTLTSQPGGLAEFEVTVSFGAAPPPGP